MRRYSLILIITLVLLIITSCDLNSNKNLVLPKTVEEVEVLIKEVPNCYYEIEEIDSDEYGENIPEGVQMSLIGTTIDDFFVGIRFLDEVSLNNGYDKIVEEIEEALYYEFEQEKGSVKIYTNDLWIYAGSKDFVSYFEGESDTLLTKVELEVPLDTIENRLKSNGYDVTINDVSEHDDEYIEYGCRKLIIATNSSSKDIITVYQMESYKNCIDYRNELMDILGDEYFDEVCSDLCWEISTAGCWTYANYVYFGTRNAANILKGE